MAHHSKYLIKSHTHRTRRFPQNDRLKDQRIGLKARLPVGAVDGIIEFLHDEPSETWMVKVHGFAKIDLPNL